MHKAQFCNTGRSGLGLHRLRTRNYCNIIGDILG